MIILSITQDNYILAHYQTFIGVIATLVVLCLFHGNNNFLTGFLKSLRDEILPTISIKASEIMEEVNKTINANDDGQHSFWSEVAKSAKPEDRNQLLKAYQEKKMSGIKYFVENYNSISSKVDEKIKLIIEAREYMFIALYTFFIALLILFLDCLCVNPDRYIMVLIYYIITTSLTLSALIWWHFWRRISTSLIESETDVPNAIYSKGKTWIRVLIKALFLFFFSLLFLFIDKFHFYSIGYKIIFLVVSITISLLFLCFWGRLFSKIKHSSSFNRQFISTHFIYITLSSPIVMLIYWAISKVSYFTNSDSLSILNYSPIISKIICTFIFFNAVVLPFILPYLKYSIVKINVIRALNVEKKSAMEKCNSANKKYNEAKKLIMSNYNNGYREHPEA